jgi:hypothetical protein
VVLLVVVVDGGDVDVVLEVLVDELAVVEVADDDVVVGGIVPTVLDVEVELDVEVVGTVLVGGALVDVLDVEVVGGRLELLEVVLEVDVVVGCGRVVDEVVVVTDPLVRPVSVARPV